MDDERRDGDLNQNSWQYRPSDTETSGRAAPFTSENKSRGDMKPSSGIPESYRANDSQYSPHTSNPSFGTQEYREKYGYAPEKRPYGPNNSYNGNGYTGPYNPNVSSFNGQHPYSQLYMPPPQPPKKKKRRKSVIIILTAIIIPAAFVGAIIAFMSNYGVDSDDELPYKAPDEYSYYTPDNSMLQTSEAPEVSANPNGPQLKASSTPEESDNEAVEVYRKASSSVVGIIAYPSGTDYTITESGEGSGIIVSSDGYIATNSHVVDDSTETGVLVKLSTGEEYIGAVVGIDKRTDLAVIKIDTEGLSAAEFADSDKVVIGQDAYAIGNPGGLQFSNSLTKGTVSAVNRIISSSDPVKYIQTDAAINPGNSGGALISSSGLIIGINASKLVAEEYEGMGFAIPSNTVIDIVNNIIRNGFVKGRAYLGITCSEWTTYAAKKNDTPVGVKIESITSKNAFSGTSVMVGDIITSINDNKITSPVELYDIIDSFKPNDEIEITLFRMKDSNSKRSITFTVNVKLLEDTGR